MEAEEGSSNGDNGEGVGLDWRLGSQDGDNGGRILGGNGVAEGEGDRGLKDGAVNNGVAIEAEEVRGLKKEAVDNGVAVVGGDGVVEGEEVRGLKNVTVNNGMAIEGGNGVAEGKVWALKNEVINSGVAIADGNGAAEDGEVSGSKNDVIGVAIADGNGLAEHGEVWGSKNEAVSNEVPFVDGNCVVYSGEVQGSKNGAVNNEVVIADEIGVTEGQEDHCLQNGTVDNVVANANEGNSGSVECFQTYKRRKHVKLSSEFEVQENSRKHMAAASQLSEQAVKKPFDLAVGNTSKDHSHDHWGNVVLKQLYHSLGNDNGGMEWCIREALMSHPKISCATTMTETLNIVKDGQECSPQLESLFYRLQSEANGHENVVNNGFSSESNGHGATGRCQRVFRDILASEKFSSLCKVLLENFRGMKPETVFDFSLINSRMKGQAYEQSPTLFLSDFQQVWRKLQNTGNQIVAMARSLSNMSKASFCEQVGISAQSSFEDEKQVLCNQESISHMKPEQTVECVAFKVGNCWHCGDKADGIDCLVCDSCEEMYHLSCIEPAVKEIPRKSWFCANCTANGIGCRHKNCVVCEQLNVLKTLDDFVGEENFPTNEETLNELEEYSNCTYDGIQVSTDGRNSSNCKICKMAVDGEKVKICGHSFCPSKYYHVRCLSSKQLKSYGNCWYCPSCICQVCLTDKDDDKIVLCDGCDHAYHIYCMKPPQNSIPKGKWFCIKCEAGIQAIRQARKAYESKKGKVGQNDSKPNEDIDKKWNKKRGRESDKVGGMMDMLINAANTLNSEEDMNAMLIDSKKTLT
ncbi:hypothetical protein JHK86_035284 [Glycine max]|nr:hypothetical protein JHK86_035284 [Glycine max]